MSRTFQGTPIRDVEKLKAIGYSLKNCESCLHSSSSLLSRSAGVIDCTKHQVAVDSGGTCPDYSADHSCQTGRYTQGCLDSPPNRYEPTGVCGLWGRGFVELLDPGKDGLPKCTQKSVERFVRLRAEAKG